MRLIYKIKELPYTIRYWLQRANKGYDYVDRTGIDTWFMRTTLAMLKEFRENLMGYPWLEEMEGKTAEECEKIWGDIIDRMIYLLTEMNEDTSSICRYNGESTKKWMDEAFDYYEKCKNEFFELFSKYFFCLWD